MLNEKTIILWEIENFLKYPRREDKYSPQKQGKADQALLHDREFSFAGSRIIHEARSEKSKFAG